MKKRSDVDDVVEKNGYKKYYWVGACEISFSRCLNWLC